MVWCDEDVLHLSEKCKYEFHMQRLTIIFHILIIKYSGHDEIQIDITCANI